MLQKILSKVGNEQMCPVAAIVRDGKLLKGLRHYTSEKWMDVSVWTMPGGRCDKNETLEMTLRREVQEEIGVTNLTIVDYIGEVPGAKDGDIVPIFFCTTDQEPRLMEPEKFSEWHWFDLEEYRKGLPKNTINEKARTMVNGYFMKTDSSAFTVEQEIPFTPTQNPAALRAKWDAEVSAALKANKKKL